MFARLTIKRMMIATTAVMMLTLAVQRVAVTLYVMVQMFRRVVSPLRHLLESMRGIGEGDRTLKLQVDGADENMFWQWYWAASQKLLEAFPPTIIARSGRFFGVHP